LWLIRKRKYSYKRYLSVPNAHTMDRPWHLKQTPSLKTADKLEAMDELKKTGLSLALVYGVHYVSTQLYGNVCVPAGFHGVLSGIFTTASPWCHLILNTMQMTETSYGTMVVTGVTRLIVGSVMGPAGQKPKQEKDEEKVE
jgi:hypothetical protein